jgi:hypothetical protein
MPELPDNPPSKALQCRRNAYYCGMLATAAPTYSDRMQLLEMRRGWLSLADSEEWLAGGIGPKSSVQAA